MKALPQSFKAGGFDHRQLGRVGNIAIFERVKADRKHFEVVRIRSHNGFVIPGTETKTPPAEFYPSSEKWGTDGFTFNDHDAARAKFEQLAFDK